ncbi:hypothetical protein [Streptomyces sp. NBC_01431]|uniref:hypothetical protein n=1 Tax=Streptomyces sp. NBC_01431 TaxID=2903863 RepID=UPI002E314D61|nr:hypothetical protein [Streptomyces sp. NBC_01431]
MPNDRLIRSVISASGISQIRCECGRWADHAVEEFLNMLGQDPDSLLRKNWMEGHVLISAFFMPSAPAVAKIMMAALAGEHDTLRREILLDSILGLSDSDSPEYLQECQSIISRGVWIFIEEASSGRSRACASYAFEILQCLEESEWVQMLQNDYSDDIPMRS